MNKYLILSLTLLFSLPWATSAQSIENPTVDQEIVEKIIEEGIERSNLMEYASWLTDVYGPRLSSSPQMKNANEYTRQVFEDLGLENARLHAFDFGKGWELKRFAMHANTPHTYFPVTAHPKAWTPGYSEPVEGEVVYLSVESAEELDSYRGTLGNKFVMLDEPRDSDPQWEGFASRNSDERLLNLANAGEQPNARRNRTPNPDARARAELRYEIMNFLQEERPLAILDYGYRGWYGQIAVSAASLPVEPGIPWGEVRRAHQVDESEIVPQISLMREHYGRIFRLLEKDQSVSIEMDLQVEFQEDDPNGYNTIAEIPGTDPELKDEVVMLGAHLDSWHAATGATDNASGSAVMMEAIRILKEVGVEPRRTIRVALWGGEEQGLHGSLNYVADEFAEAEGAWNQSGEMIQKENYDNFSAYYNIDNGTGQVRGIYLQQNEALRPLFRTWLSPFAEWDATTVSYRNTGSTDHVAFDRVGLPGFQFIQDPIEYGTVTHHSNMDYYERLVEQDLKRTAVIVATFVYHTAMLDEKLPRK